MSVSKLSIEFSNFMRESGLESSAAFREFCATRDLMLRDICGLVIERPGLSRLHFLEVAEVILQQVKGRAEVYTEYYEHLRWVVNAVQQTGTITKFADIYRMANIKAKEVGVTKLPCYQTAYVYAHKIAPEYFKKGEDKEE